MALPQRLGAVAQIRASASGGSARNYAELHPVTGLHNIAWLLRRLPLFLLPEGGRCCLQPVSVFDLARIAAELNETEGNVVLDLAGPETFTFADFVAQIRWA